MPPVAIALLALVVGVPAQTADPCSRTGQSLSFPQLKDLIPGCTTEVPPPHGGTAIRIASNGELVLVLNGPRAVPQKAIRPIEPAASLGWAPTASAFFVNDGEGSGQTSVFRFFRVMGSRISEDRRPYGVAVNDFRKSNRCDPKATNPDIWGLGWSDNDASVFVLVQRAIHDGCGPDVFSVLRVDVSASKIVERFSEPEAQKRFGHLLPPAFRLTVRSRPAVRGKRTQPRRRL
jgi:hypothetical protein